jgi:cobalt-precorrin-5B (C1)-methyltransferase
MKGLRTGYTTGACAAAAAKAAASLLVDGNRAASVSISLPGGETTSFPITSMEAGEKWASAVVKKFAGDDPDVTDGVVVVVTVQRAGGTGVVFEAGEGVGRVTKAGLAVPPGEPAINPGPRRMIEAALREVTSEGLRVRISIPGGGELAKRTFNPRLGVIGGLSILGTTGKVHPYSSSALKSALACALDVAVAASVAAPVLVPGHIGEQAARRHFVLEQDQVIQVSNEWGYMLDQARERMFSALLVLGHPGKLAKLAAGQWDTHSSRSESAVPWVADRARKVLGVDLSGDATVEAQLAALAKDQRGRLAGEIATKVRSAVEERTRKRFTVAVALINLKGDILGESGDVGPWRRRN